MKKILIMMVALVLSLAAKAQTLYELKYYDIETEIDYIGLFYFTSEEEGLLKCVAADPKLRKRGVSWETAYMSTYEKNKDGNFICFFPYEAQASDGGIFPAFFLGYDKKGQATENMVVFQDFMEDEDLDEDNAFECEYFRELNIADKDEKYFKQFYNDDDEMLEEILKARNILQEQTTHKNPVKPNTDGKTPTMHLLMVAATNDENIGESVETDLKLVIKNFSGFAEQMGIPYNEVIVKGNEYNKKNVEKAISNLDPDPQDIVVFVYSGHGFRFKDDTDPFPRMFVSADGSDDLDNSTQMSTTDVFKKISNKNARLTIFLTDCCNSNVDAYKSMVETMSFGTRSGQNNTDINKLKALFIDQDGVVRVTAAKAGQYALCDASGGYLLTSFLNNIRAQVSAIKNDAPSWNKIVDNASKAVEKKSSQQIDEAGNPEDPQVVVKSIKLKNVDGSNNSVSNFTSNDVDDIDEEDYSSDESYEKDDDEMSDLEAMLWLGGFILFIILLINWIVRLIRGKK